MLTSGRFCYESPDYIITQKRNDKGAPNMSGEIDQREESTQEIMPSFDFLLEAKSDKNPLLAEHRTWLKSIKRERPLPKKHYRVAVYIRYFNQTRYEDYLSVHKKQFLDTLALCPNWDFVGFYVDEGGTAPNMESAPEWSRLLQDCYDGKIDLVITQKASNISKKLSELAFCARLLASLQRPVGIYFVSEDIYTLASYYHEDLHDPFFLPSPDWKILSDDEPRREMLHD